MSKKRNKRNTKSRSKELKDRRVRRIQTIKYYQRKVKRLSERMSEKDVWKTIGREIHEKRTGQKRH